MINFINEAYTNGYKIGIVNILFILSVFFAIFVIISKNPVISVLFLIGLFLSIACYLLILGITFIGLSYLLVYVGAVSILFLFILMLINVRVSELLNETSKSIPLILIIAICFNFIIFDILPFNISNTNIFFDYGYIINNIINNILLYINNVFVYFDYNITFTIVYIFSKFWEISLLESTHIITLGNVMYTSYSMWLIISSIILLLAMIGSIIITIKQSSFNILQLSLVNSPNTHTYVTVN